MYGWPCKIVMATLGFNMNMLNINEVIIKLVCHLQEHLDLVH